MNASCSNCSQDFVHTQADLDFYESVSPVFDGVKYIIPPPKFCPDCRQQRRLSMCNERNFYPANCDLCNKRMITEHPKHANKEVYCRSCWHSDRWDPCESAQDYDFSRSFFEQLHDVWKSVPLQNTLVEGTNSNSDYMHYAGFAKNCYLIMHSDYCEDCYYGYGFKKAVSCVDGFYNLSCELCYDCIDVHSCYGLKGCQDCINCNTSAFLKDCIGCQNCFLCVGQREKEYCFENKQLTKDEYNKKMQNIDLGSYKQYQEFHCKLTKLAEKQIYKEFHGHNTEGCSGDYLINCKGTNSSFDCEDVEDGKYLYQVVTGAKNVQDIYQYGLNLRESYECSIAGLDSYHILFSHNIHVSCSDLTYCWYLHSCKDCFGCVSMHSKQYCILNKQYTKEQYNILAPKIIEHMKSTGEWGEFFPTSFSPFGYNKTSANLYYPLAQSQVKEKGWKWDDSPNVMPEALKTIKAEQLLDNTLDIPDDILNWAIVCEVTGKPFKITPHEFKFYKEQRLPIPRRDWQQRHFDRAAKRNPRQFWDRNCDKCSKEIRTTYSLNRPEKIYCEECYLQELY